MTQTVIVLYFSVAIIVIGLKTFKVFKMYREYFYWADYASDPNFSDQETAEVEPETEEDEVHKKKIEHKKVTKSF